MFHEKDYLSVVLLHKENLGHNPILKSFSHNINKNKKVEDDF